MTISIYLPPPPLSYLIITSCLLLFILNEILRGWSYFSLYDILLLRNRLIKINRIRFNIQDTKILARGLRSQNKSKILLLVVHENVAEHPNLTIFILFLTRAIENIQITYRLLRILRV